MIDKIWKFFQWFVLFPVTIHWIDSLIFGSEISLFSIIKFSLIFAALHYLIYLMIEQIKKEVIEHFNNEKISNQEKE